MSLDFCDGGWQEMFNSLRDDVHAPLFYILLRIFINIAGISEWTGRMPAVLAGAATLPALYFLIVELNRKKAGVMAVLILACSPMFLEFSREVHPYSLSAFFAVLSWFFFVRLIKRAKKVYAICYAFSSGLLLLTFYLGMIVVLSQFLFWQIFPFAKRKKKLIFYAWIGGACVFSFWLPAFIKQATTNKISHDVEVYFPGGIKPFDAIRLLSDLFWGTGARGIGLVLMTASAIIAFFIPLFLLMRWKKHFEALRLMPLWIFWAPVLIFTILSLVKPLYLSRYCTMLVPFVALLWGSAIKELGPKLRGFVLIMIIFASLLSYRIYLKNLPREDWRGVGQYLISHMKPEDVVVADSMTAASCVVYYFKILERLELNKNVFSFEMFYQNTNGKYLFPDRTLWYVQRPKAGFKKQLAIIQKENIFLGQQNVKSGFALYSFAGSK